MSNGQVKRVFRWKLPLIVCILLLCTLTAASWWKSAQAQKEVRALTFEDLNLTSLYDGAYAGEYTYGGFTYKVNVLMQDHKIKDIKIVANRITKHAKMAEGVVQNVLSKGNINVDVIAGATTTSKALLKAIEQAIRCDD